MFRLEQKLARRRLVGELLDPLGQIGVAGKSIDSQNANLLILVPAGRTEDTVSFLLGPSAVRYVVLPSSSFDALNASITYTRLLGGRQTAPGYTTGGTATTDLFTLGLDGTSVYEPGFGPEQITIASPSIGWSRSNIGLGNRLSATRAARPIAIMPTSRSPCPRRSPTFRARSPRSA
jgi:hypothetical protein